jgi:hypothetical protein
MAERLDWAVIASCVNSTQGNQLEHQMARRHGCESESKKRTRSVRLGEVTALQHELGDHSARKTEIIQCSAEAF